MSDTVGGSDLGIGLALLFGAVAIVGSGGMLVGYEHNVVAGWSFAAAISAGTLAVAAVHLFGHRDA